MAKPSYATMIGVLILLTAAFLMHHTFDAAYQTSILTAGRGPVFFPRIVLSAILVLSVVVIVEGQSETATRPTVQVALVVLAAIGLTGAYIFSIEKAGFVIPTMLFAFLLPFVLGYKNWLVVAVIAVSYTLAVWYIFEKIFLIILPSSPWFEVI